MAHGSVARSQAAKNADTLQRELNKSEEAHKALQQGVNDLKDGVTNLRAKVSDLTVEVSDLTVEVSNLTVEVKTLKDDKASNDEALRKTLDTSSYFFG